LPATGATACGDSCRPVSSSIFVLAAGWPFTVRDGRSCDCVAISPRPAACCIRQGYGRMFAAMAAGTGHWRRRPILTVVEFYPYTYRAIFRDLVTYNWAVPFLRSQVHIPGQPCRVGSNYTAGWFQPWRCWPGVIKYRAAYCDSSLGVLAAGCRNAALSISGRRRHFGTRCGWLRFSTCRSDLLGALVLQRWLTEACRGPRAFAQVKRGSLLGLWSIPVHRVTLGMDGLRGARPCAGAQWTAERCWLSPCCGSSARSCYGITTRLHAWLPSMVMGHRGLGPLSSAA